VKKTPCNTIHTSHALCIKREKDKPRQGVVANALNGARGKWCDIDGQAEGRLSGSEGVNLFRGGAVGFIDWLDVCVTITLCVA